MFLEEVVSDSETTFLSYSDLCLVCISLCRLALQRSPMDNLQSIRMQKSGLPH